MISEHRDAQMDGIESSNMTKILVFQPIWLAKTMIWMILVDYGADDYVIKSHSNRWNRHGSATYIALK